MIHRVRGVSRKLVLLASIGAAVLLFATVAGARSTYFDNGGFETGDLSFWSTDNSGNGGWFVSQSLYTPLSNPNRWNGAAEHEYGAVSDSTGPGTHIMYRFITVGKNTKIQMFVYYKNRTTTFCSPASLDYAFAGCNQQYRIDILQPSADPASVAPSDVLMNLFQTGPNSPRVYKPNHLGFKLKGISGNVMLRFAEVDNQEVFNASVDGIRINNG